MSKSLVLSIDNISLPPTKRGEEKKAIFSQAEAARLLKWDIVSFSKEETNEEIFIHQGIIVQDRKIGEGTFAKVYQAFYRSHHCICKIEKSPRLIDFGKNFWRHSHFASARLELPHLVKILSGIVTVSLSDGRKQKFFLPADKAKKFGKALRKIDPQAIVELETQLIELAPGKPLSELMKKESVSFHPSKIHFKRILEALHDFLKKAYQANFIHRDLKPENVMYDPASGIVTIIDTGESSRLSSRKKNKGKEKSSATSQKRLGTKRFMSPRVIEGHPHGSEVDFFSAAMLLLNLISKKDFDIFLGERSPGTAGDSFLHQDPDDFLSLYFQALPAEEGKSETEKTLKKTPLLEKLIELYFQISSRRTPEEEKASKKALAAMKEITSQLKGYPQLIKNG